MTRSILRRLGYVSFFVFCLASLMLLGIIPIQEWFDVRDTKEELLVELKEIEELNGFIIRIYHRMLYEQNRSNHLGVGS